MCERCEEKKPDGKGIDWWVGMLTITVCLPCYQALRNGADVWAVENA